MSDADFRFLRKLIYSRHIQPRLLARVDRDDLVQEAAMHASENEEQLRDENDAVRRSWLKTIALRVIYRAYRDHRRGKRNYFRERRIDVGIDNSSSAPGLRNDLKAEQTSPISRAARNEQQQRLEFAMSELTENERLALELYHLQGTDKTLSDVAQELGCSISKVHGLIKSAQRKLKDSLGAEGESRP